MAQLCAGSWCRGFISPAGNSVAGSDRYVTDCEGFRSRSWLGSNVVVDVHVRWCADYSDLGHRDWASSSGSARLCYCCKKMTRSIHVLQVVRYCYVLLFRWVIIVWWRHFLMPSTCWFLCRFFIGFFIVFHWFRGSIVCSGYLTFDTDILTHCLNWSKNIYYNAVITCAQFSEARWWLWTILSGVGYREKSSFKSGFKRTKSSCSFSVWREFFSNSWSR